MSCITAQGTINGGWTGWADSLIINCVNNQNNSLNFGNNFCHGKGTCDSEKFYSIDNEIFYLESNSYNGGTSSVILWKFNESGYHDLSSIWMPESCQGNDFQNMISKGMHCGDDLGRAGAMICYGIRMTIQQLRYPILWGQPQVLHCLSQEI